MNSTATVSPASRRRLTSWVRNSNTAARFKQPGERVVGGGLVQELALELALADPDGEGVDRRLQGVARPPGSGDEQLGVREVLGRQRHGLGLDRLQGQRHVVERLGGGDDLAGPGVGQPLEVELPAVDLQGRGGQLLERSGEHAAAHDHTAEAHQRQQGQEEELADEATRGGGGLGQGRVVEILGGRRSRAC